MPRICWLAALLAAGLCTSARAQCEDCCEACCPPPLCERGTIFSWDGDWEEGGDPRDEPLSSGRPDFTESTSAVGRGVVQLEMGYTYVKDDEDGVETREHSYPETLLRVGVFADWLEARLGWNYADSAVRTGGVSDRSEGAEDMYLGLKLALMPQSDFLPAMSIMPQMTVPTGADDFTADEVLPGVNWLYSWDVNDLVSVAGSTQVNKAIDEDGSSYAEWAQSLSLAWGLAENLGAFTEWFVIVPDDAEFAETEHYFNGGFQLHVSNNFALDIRGGVGLNEAAADCFFGTGAAIRF